MLWVKTMMEDYGNPSSRHTKGVEAERYLRGSQGNHCGHHKVSEKEIFFTSGGTESNNWALIGGAMANRRAGNHVITTAIEHAAVIHPCCICRNRDLRLRIFRWMKRAISVWRICAGNCGTPPFWYPSCM